MLLVPNEWKRVGRGREFQFYCLPGEWSLWLENGLPESSSGYVVLSQPTGGSNSAFELADVDRLAADRRKFLNLWVGDGDLTDSGAMLRFDDLDAACACNGLLLLQHGRTFKGRTMASRIAHVPQVANAAGQMVKHSEYAKRYDCLRKYIEKALDIPTDNTLGGPDTSLRMSGPAAEAHRRGEIVFKHPPFSATEG